MKNAKPALTAKTAADLKAARAAWMKIHPTNASAGDKRKAKEAYAGHAVRAAEEVLGEKILRSGRRLVVK